MLLGLGVEGFLGLGFPRSGFQGLACLGLRLLGSRLLGLRFLGLELLQPTTKSWLKVTIAGAEISGALGNPTGQPTKLARFDESDRSSEKHLG